MLEIKKFEADWCGPCRMLKPVFQQLESKYGNSVKFSYIDVDKNNEIAQKYSVRGIPLVVIEKDGKEVGRFSGVQSEKTYENSLNKFV